MITVTATRTGAWWAIESPSILGLLTQAKRRDKIPALVEEVAAMLGVNAPAESGTVSPTLDDEVSTMLEHTQQARATVQAAETEVSAASGAVLARLRSSGLNVRDVATLIGVSPQRVAGLDTTRIAA